VDESSYRAELEALPTNELYLRARGRAARRLDVRFFWTLLRSIPAAEVAAGQVEEAEGGRSQRDRATERLTPWGKGTWAKP
jgi:hypothetical protein